MVKESSELLVPSLEVSVTELRDGIDRVHDKKFI